LKRASTSHQPARNSNRKYDEQSRSCHISLRRLGEQQRRFFGSCPEQSNFSSAALLIPQAERTAF